MWFSLLCILAVFRQDLAGQTNCDNFEFLVCQEEPHSPWPSFSTTNDPSAFNIYYRVYLKTKNGNPLPQNHGFNFFAFTGQAIMPNHPLSSQLNVAETMLLSQQSYGGPGINPYLQYLEIDKKGEVTWVVGNPAAADPCAETPISLPLAPAGSSSDRVLLFILVFDALSGDGVKFDAEDSHIVDCACSLNQVDPVKTCSTSTAVVMPSPTLCQSAALNFLPMEFSQAVNRYVMPVKITGITAGQIVQRIDYGVHIEPDMNGIALLDFTFFESQVGPVDAEFRKRKNTDGTFDVYISNETGWLPSSNEAIIGYIAVDGIYNLSQGGDLYMHLIAGRFAKSGITCGMEANDLMVTIPGFDACSSPISLTTDASYGTDCTMSNIYTLTHTAPSSIFLDNLFIKLVFNDLDVAPEISGGDLPCPDCWVLSNDNGLYVLDYEYDVSNQGVPLELVTGTNFSISFPGQTGCFEPFVFYAEALEKGAAEKCALGVYLNDFPICDPRISVQFYSPIAGGLGVYDYKSTLETGSYSVENDDDCQTQTYCPDLEYAPYTLTADINYDNPLCGVSTFDLVKISKHVLNAQPFTMPEQYVAADINKNGQVTTFDIVELRKLILGIYDTLTLNQSWHYVDDSWAFPTPALSGTINPYVPFYDDKNIIQNVQPGSSPVFKAIKVGDLTGDCNCGEYPLFNGDVAENRNISEDKEQDWLSIPTEKVLAEQNGLISIPVFANGRAPWLGLQSGFRFDPSLFEFVSVAPNVAAGISMGNFGLGKAGDGEVRFAWSFSDPDALLTANEWLFTLQLRKKTNRNYVAMDEWLTLDNNIMKGEAYADAAGEISMSELRLNWAPGQNTAANTTGLSVHAAPNPFKHAASTVFIQAITPGEAMIELADFNGKTVSSQKTLLQIGENRVQLARDAEQLPVGTYLLVVHQNGQRAHQRIVKI